MYPYASNVRRLCALLALALLTALALGGCGGGGGGSAGVASGPASVLTSPASAALASGDARSLSTEDAASLLRYTTNLTADTRTQQTQAVASIYGNTDIALQLNHTTNSSDINISRSAVATPLILSDDGSGMAAIAQIGTGRGLAYGANVLGWMAGVSIEQQHLPFFNRAFKWLMTGSGDGNLPSTLKFSTAGYDANAVKNYLTRAGSAGSPVACKVDDPANTCWQTLDLIVFGSATTNNTGLSDLVRSYLTAGKAVVYMHSSWVDSAGGRSVLAGMGMGLGGYPGNYYAAAAGVSVGSTRTRADALTKADQFAAMPALLQQLTQSTLTASDLPSLTQAIDTVHNALAGIQSSGVDVFSDPDFKHYRALVLWADWYRKQVTYGGSLSSKGDAGTFLRTYASDSFLVFNRASTTVPPNGAGDYMPAAAANLAVTSDFEALDVTIAQTSGKTLIGRGAVPGKTVTIEVVDAAGADSLGLQTSYLREWGDAVNDAVYARPRRPNSFTVPMARTGPTVFVTPFGGPLVLSYSGATAGTVVKLRIKGSTQYAHYDFTQNPSQSDIDAATQALQEGKFGWQTAKFTGGEVQQTTRLAKSAMGTLTPQDYVLGRLKGQLFDSNHFANGYDNMPMSTAAQDLCSQLGWVCTGTLHKAPNVQHFIGWLATCGFLCSGNPSDGSAGIGSGWGHAHELGHNTVQRVMHIAPHGKGCVVECDNNILASATMLRQADMLGVDTGHSLDHTGLYGDIVANRATGLSGEAQRADMETRLWAKGTDRQDPLRAVHFQLAFQYAKLRRGLPQPTMTSTLEFFQLLTKADRLVSRAWDASNKAKYGMGRFADNTTIVNEDLFYVLSSKIIGQDMRKHFAMYGIPLTQNALDSVADLNLPQAARSFYALQAGKHNQLATGQWLAIETATPAYPW